RPPAKQLLPRRGDAPRSCDLPHNSGQIAPRGRAARPASHHTDWRARAKCAKATSRVDMPQRAALESAFSLVLGAAQTRVPCCNISADANRGNWRRNCQRRGSADWGVRGSVARIDDEPWPHLAELISWDIKL